MILCDNAKKTAAPFETAADKLRHNKYMLLQLNAEPVTIDEFLIYLKV